MIKPIQFMMVLLVGFVVSLVAAPTTFAGGWAVVTLDQLPSEMRAGQTFTLGMMVRQHGVTPISADPFGNGSLKVRISAQNLTSKETIEWSARQEGEVGHFVAEVTFPSAGSWTWAAQPGAFEATQLGSVTILPALAATETTQATTLPATPWIWLAGLLVVGGILMLLMSRRRRIPVTQ